MGHHPVRLLQEKDLVTPGGSVFLRLLEEDMAEIFPGLLRYTLTLSQGGKVLRTFRTNTLEYTSPLPLNAGDVARDRFSSWESALEADPDWLPPLGWEDTSPLWPVPPNRPDVVIIQGSPRPDGSSACMAGWVEDEAHRAGLSVEILFPDFMEIHPCIGCYQCYNNGRCTFSDEMDRAGPAIDTSRLLVIASPVYTNSVPGALKVLIDRCQAIHAAHVIRDLTSPPPDQVARIPTAHSGLLLGTAGRAGAENFTCVRRVVHAFFRNIGFIPAQPLLFDRLDEIRDIREVAGAEIRVREAVRKVLDIPGERQE